MINKIIDNQAKGETYCQGVLGSEARVKALAGFWDRHAQLVHLVGVNGLIEYTQIEEFNKEELEAFKKGLSVFGIFCDKCYEESSQATKK